MAIDRGLYAIVNVHHDSALWADVNREDANLTMIEEKFYRLWYQIGVKLACLPSSVAFKPLNESPGNTAKHAQELNKLNNLFLQAINDAGGFNPQRVVALIGPGEDIIRTSLWFERPDISFQNPYALQVYYYSPYPFTSAAWKEPFGALNQITRLWKGTFERNTAAKSIMFIKLTPIFGQFQD